MISVVKGVSFAVGLFFLVGYFYQIVYMIVGLIKEPKVYQETEKHKYAVLISARNERTVIAQLIESIKHQKYPQELIDIFVVADNCTDDTADIARAAGAIVYERFNKEYVGKGYALDYLLKQIGAEYGDCYAGYFVFDADNVLDENYVTEMNKVFCAGYRIVTSYRNSKNYGDSWISAGYALWFLREAQYINNPRMMLGTSCAVSGTGFLVAREVFEANGGWKHHLLTEDIEFTTDSIAHGEKIGYCGTAIIYDEQPVTFKVSWNQRLRWSKGFYQVFHRYGAKLGSRIFKAHSFSAYDMFMTLAPGTFLTLGTFILAFLGILVSVFHPEIRHDMLLVSLGTIGYSLLSTYVMMFTYGLITTITEWEKIHAPAGKKIKYLFTFPIYIFSYIPIGVTALFKKIQWVPIEHHVVKSADEIKSAS